MNRRTNIKTVTIVIVLVALLCLLTGASRLASPLQVERFQIDCTDSSCYLVDTATGQVWRSSDRDFMSPKLDVQPENVPAEVKNLLGQWKSTDKEGQEITLRLEVDGNARGVEKGKIHEGRWQTQGEKIVLTFDDDTLWGQIESDGRMTLWENDDDEDRLHLQKVK